MLSWWSAHRAGKKSLTNMWATWLHNPCCLRGPHIGKETKMWPTREQSGYITPAISGVPEFGQIGYVTLVSWGTPYRGGNKNMANM